MDDVTESVRVAWVLIGQFPLQRVEGLQRYGCEQKVERAHDALNET